MEYSMARVEERGEREGKGQVARAIEYSTNLLPPRGQDRENSWKFERTIPFRSLAFHRRSKDSPLQSGQDPRGGSNLRLKFEPMSNVTRALEVKPSRPVWLSSY